MAAATLSPRISFSHDLDISSSSAAAAAGPRRLDASLMLPSSSPSDDFDFSTSREISTAPDPSPADELFAYGMLLPLSSIKQAAATRIEKAPEDKKPENLNSNAKSPSPSFWTNIGRSSSVGTGSKSRLASICPFPRSKSTGSYQNPSQNQGRKMRNLSKTSQRQIQSQSQNQNQNTKNWYNYYYSRSSKRSSQGNEVRINPVINVPAHFIPRGGSTGGSSTTSGSGGGGGGGGGNSFFAYLLCNCRDKNFKELEGYSP